MPRKIGITDKPGFSYFLSTPCESWDALEYHKEWCASKQPINKAKITIAITRQLEWFMKEGSEEERKEAKRMLKQFKEGIKIGGYIDDFWVKMDLERKANIKDAEVSARIRDIEADKHLLMNERSRNVLNETIKEHNKASEALSDFANVEYNARKKRKQNHQSDRYTSPSPPSPKLRNSPVELSKFTDNPFLEEESEADDVIAIDDIPCELSFVHEDLDDEFFLGKTNVSRLFRIYQSESIRIAKDGGLLIESHVHEILSLSSILMLNPNSHSTVMIDIFGSPLLDKIHKELMPIQQIVLEPTCEATFRKAIKMANKSSDDATDWFCIQLANEETLRDSAGFVIFDCLRTLPMSKIRSEHSETTHITNYLDRIMRGFFNNPNQHVVQWPNTALDESKARKIEGRSKQPDFIVSIIHQLQSKSVVFIGEVSPPSQKNNVYKNCNDLIRLGIFMKDSLDSAIDKGADIKIIGFQCIGFKLDFYIMDLTHGIYTMVHFGQVMFPASIKEMAAFVDEMETLLRIQEIFYESFNTLYAKLCAPSPPSNKVTLKKDTLCTPKFRKLVNKTRDCNRSCPFWFGRF